MQATSSRSTKAYVKKKRLVRQTVPEAAFGAGMYYNDNPLETGQALLLVNLIQKDFGMRTRPRGGLHPVLEGLDLGTDMECPYIHHSGVTLITNNHTGATALRRYALVVNRPEAQRNDDFVTLDNSKLVIELPHDREHLLQEAVDESSHLGSSLVLSIGNASTGLKIRHDNNNSLIKISGMFVTDPTPKGYFSGLNGNNYVMTDQGLYRLEVYESGGVYTHVFDSVVPKTLGPQGANKTGYNMLLDNPYDFPNTESQAAIIQGITPYDAIETTKLKLSPRLGEKTLFKMAYTYDPTKTYKVKWEAKGAYEQSMNVLQTQQASPSYSGGAEVAIEYTPNDEQFTVVASIYDSLDLNEPLWIMSLPMVTASGHMNASRPASNFLFKTCMGMMEWKGQVAIYGVDDAETGIFLSAVNDPTYFPYPQNFIDVGERIISVKETMGELAIITEHSMFIATMQEVGYTVRKVQANLQVRDQDATSIFTVRNLVHIKSSNYFYMIVPDMRNDQGNLQLAPITSNMTYLFDNFKREAYKIINMVYNLNDIMQAPTSLMQFDLMDYKCIQDGSRIRNVYRFKLSNTAAEGVVAKTKYLDMHLIYDSIFRSWTIETYETTKDGMFLFHTLATGYAEYLSISEQGAGHRIEWLRVVEDQVQDTYTLDNGMARAFENLPVLDTGKRSFSNDMKKRFRSVIIEMNNLSDQELELNHLFFVDDQERTDLYKYEVVHITDPSDVNYGSIYVERTYTDPDTVASEVFVERAYVEPDVLPGTTELDSWKLSTSVFPDVTICKVHINVSGKGYYPRLRLISRSPKLFEINSISWVWREMSGR